MGLLFGEVGSVSSTREVDILYRCHEMIDLTWLINLRA